MRSDDVPVRAFGRRLAVHACAVFSPLMCALAAWVVMVRAVYLIYHGYTHSRSHTCRRLGIEQTYDHDASVVALQHASPFLDSFMEVQPVAADNDMQGTARDVSHRCATERMADDVAELTVAATQLRCVSAV